MQTNTSYRDPSRTRRQLKIAARREFNLAGFFLTDTNKIAKLAGYAPGTFYRHFKDKLEIFIEVYRDWHWELISEIERAFNSAANPNDIPRQLCSSLLKLYSEGRLFRASLWTLSFFEPRITGYKLDRRRELVTTLNRLRQQLNNDISLPLKEALTFALILERLIESIIENEYESLDIAPEEAKQELLKLIHDFLSPSVKIQT